MKKILNKSIYLLSFFLIFVACDDTEITELNPEANTVISVSNQTLILTEGTADEDVLTVNWTQPDFGFDSAATYKVQIDFSGGDFSSPQSVNASTNLSKTFTGVELNGKLLALGLDPNVASNVDIRVETKLSNFKYNYSDPISLNVTPYPALVDLSTTWGIVGDATPNAWDGPDVPFYKTSQENVFAAYITVIDGFIKFRENNDWTVNYGDTGGDLSLEAGGSDIAVTAGTYLITFDLANLEYTIADASSEDVWGLVGSATPNTWDGPDWPFYPAGNDIYVSYITLADGLIKFRLNNDWGLNYGDTGIDGSLDNGGDDIAVTAGSYKITMNLFDFTYTIEPN